MGLVKTSVTIPEDLLRQARGISGNISMLITEALREYLRGKRVAKAAGSFGAWNTREQSSVDIVDGLRREEGRTRFYL